MEETAWGSSPNSTDAARWASTHGLSHPSLADSSQSLLSIVSAYPTYLVIDQTMTVVDDAFWPNLSYLLGLL